MKLFYQTSIITFCLLWIISCRSTTIGKIPQNGTYTYDLAFAEFGGKSLGANCVVKIDNDSITVFHNGGNISGNRGDILSAGHIRWHKETKQWIIAESDKDSDADEVGGCSDGPLVIDFRHKKVWLC